MWLLASRLALGAGGPGESITWNVRIAGIQAGQAGTHTVDAPGEAVFIDTWVRNAEWYAALYTIDDQTRSTWLPGQGSQRYETRFREGGFQQDQDMRLSAETCTVWRHQHFKEGWREWTTAYPGQPNLEDPVTAVFALRQRRGSGPWSLPVFSGEATWPLDASVVRHDVIEDTPLGDVDVVVLSLQTRHRGEWEQKGRFLIAFTDDERQIPVQMIIRSSVGHIRVDLVEYTPPTAID